MLRVEDVAGGRVVDDDGLLQVAADLTKILDVIALMVVTTFAEKTMMHDAVDVELVEKWVSVLGDRRCKHDDLVKLTHSLQERIHAGSFYDVDVMVLTFDLDWDGEICLMQNLRWSSARSSEYKKDKTHLEAAVHKSFVEI